MTLIQISCVFLVLALAEAAFVGYPCNDLVKCSVTYSSCVNGTCECDTGFFQQGNSKYSCLPRKIPGFICSLSYPNDIECVDNAFCQTPYHVHQGRYTVAGNQPYYNFAVCKCMPGYQSTGRACEPRIDLGEQCVYHETMCDDCRDTGDGQCKEHAACRTDVDASGATTHVCQCVEEYYVPNNNNVCVKEIPLGGNCNNNGKNECVTENAECVAKDGISTCRCSDGYKQNGNHACVVQAARG